MHIAILICIRLALDYKYYSLQLVIGKQSNISYVHIFNCVIYASIAPTQNIKMGSFQDLRFIM